MESSKQPLTRANVVGGMSQAMPAHLVSADKWWNAIDMRFRDGVVKQYPCLVLLSNTGSSTVAAGRLIINEFVVVPVNVIYGVLLVFTPRTVFTYSTSSGTLGLILKDNLNYDASYPYRWSWYIVPTGLVFTNPLNEVQYFDGTSVSDLITSGPEYKARYVIAYYNHVVIANLSDEDSVLYPNRVAWSDVDNGRDFEPTVSNEADFYDIEQVGAANLIGHGVTGLAMLSNDVAIYLPDAIWLMSYVGLDNGLMQIRKQVSGLGSIYHNCVVAYNNRNYFIGADDFYVFDGVEAVSIGADIRNFFFADVDNEALTPFWSHLDRQNCEISWFYNSKSMGAGAAIVYNYKNGTFYRRTLDGFTYAMTTVKFTGFKSFGEWTGTDYDGWTGIEMDDLGDPQTFEGTLYGAYNVLNQRLINREELPDDLDSVIVQSPQPVLETGDIFYEQLELYKEIDTMLVDFGYDTAAGIEVFVSARSHLRDAVTYISWGLWTPTLFEERLVSLRTAGRVFRFKFQPTADDGVIRGVQYYAFGENVYKGLPEK